jgi:hypothetical protein
MTFIYSMFFAFLGLERLRDARTPGLPSGRRVAAAIAGGCAILLSLALLIRAPWIVEHRVPLGVGLMAVYVAGLFAALCFRDAIHPTLDAERP